MSAVLARSPLPIWNADEGILLATTVFNTGYLDLSKFVNGSVRGNVFCDVVGTLEIIQERVPGGASMIFNVPQDATLAAFSFPFIVAVFWPFVSFRFTVGAGDTTTLEAAVTATPV
jgi:hypothetical protein